MLTTNLCRVPRLSIRLIGMMVHRAQRQVYFHTFVVSRPAYNLVALKYVVRVMNEL
jgi:hypothetical protein